MRLTKPSESDIDSTNDFLTAAESVLEREKFSVVSPEDNWQDWDDDDEDKQYLLKLRKALAEEEGVEEDKFDSRILMYEYLKKKFAPASCDYRRVVWGMLVLIPYLNLEKTYMDFHPGIQEFHVAPEM